jgi:peptide chain release factor 2
MYERYLANNRLSFEQVRRDVTPSGIRVWQIRLDADENKGRHFQLLLNEVGAHRIVHTVAGKRQTSFATVEVEPLHVPRDLRILDSQLRIERMRGSGPGGQHRNKVETAIRMTHLPTGIQAYACTRSQAGSLQLASRVLHARVAAAQRGEGDAVRSQGGSFGTQRRSYRLHGASQGVVDHVTGRRASARRILDDARLDMLA